MGLFVCILIDSVISVGLLQVCWHAVWWTLVSAFWLDAWVFLWWWIYSVPSRWWTPLSIRCVSLTPTGPLAGTARRHRLQNDCEFSHPHFFFDRLSVFFWKHHKGTNWGDFPGNFEPGSEEPGGGLGGVPVPVQTRRCLPTTVCHITVPLSLGLADVVRCLPGEFQKQNTFGLQFGLHLSSMAAWLSVALKENGGWICWKSSWVFCAPLCAVKYGTTEVPYLCLCTVFVCVYIYSV